MAVIFRGFLGPLDTVITLSETLQVIPRKYWTMFEEKHQGKHFQKVYYILVNGALLCMDSHFRKYIRVF